MVFYFSPREFPCNVSEWKDNVSEIYDTLAHAGNIRNDGYTYTATPNALMVTTELPEENDNFDSITYTIDRVEFQTTPSGTRIKITLSA